MVLQTHRMVEVSTCPTPLGRGIGGVAPADLLCLPPVTVVALVQPQHVVQESLVPQHPYIEQRKGGGREGIWRGTHPRMG